MTIRMIKPVDILHSDKAPWKQNMNKCIILNSKANVLPWPLLLKKRLKQL